jgi:serine/threonine protein kinase
MREMDKIGPYQILEVVRRGALYRAKDKEGKEVALKAVAAAGLTPEARERFNREGEICRTLEHPNLVKVFDTGEADGYLYQAMEMLQGADLGKVFAEGRHFTWEQKLSIMEQIAEGLEYAHARHLVHRDIKPANIFLENSGRVKVLDFGMVRVAESELTRVGSTVGTANYMAPEQIRAERCTTATDVFSAGIVFFQLASGRHPFSARDRSLPQIVNAIVFEATPKLNQLCPDAPEGLEFILNRALEKDPAHRIQNAGDLKQALGLCRMTMGMAPLAPAPPAAPPASPDDAGKTRILPIPGGQPQELEDPGKTRVIRRTPPTAQSDPPAPTPNPPAQPSAALPPEQVETKVFKRPEGIIPPPPPPPPPVTPPKPPVQPPSVIHPPSRSSSGLQFRFCPHCTNPNPPDAVVCGRCQAPLGVAGGTDDRKPTQWALYIAIGVAAVLAIILVIVLMTR